jgi:hypothetical protein
VFICNRILCDSWLIGPLAPVCLSVCVVCMFGGTRGPWCWYIVYYVEFNWWYLYVCLIHWLGVDKILDIVWKKISSLRHYNLLLIDAIRMKMRESGFRDVGISCKLISHWFSCGKLKIIVLIFMVAVGTALQLLFFFFILLIMYCHISSYCI